MKERYHLNYRQNPPKPVHGKAAGGEGATSTGATKHPYLHDHRTRDALHEYLGNLET